MRGFFRTMFRSSLALAIAIAATMIAPDVSYARGGGGGGGGRGGGGRGGGGRGGGKGGPSKGGNTKGGNNNSAKPKNNSDYIEQKQREDADDQRPGFLDDALYDSLVNSASDDRDAALRAAREKASGNRRDETESGAHPL